LAWILVHDLGDIAICTRLTAYMDAAPNADKISDVIAVIRNALAAYDICRQNRNQFTHFRLNYDPATEKLSLARQGKTARLERVPFPDSLEDMRRVAREISGLCTYLNDSNAFLTRHNTDTPLPLPDKVNLPALIWTPPPQKPPRQRRPRRPSPATRRKVAMGGGG
jgi:hypothetical protein